MRWSAFSPADRVAIRLALVDRARRDPLIAGAARVGSAARDAEDAWSDIDLVLQLAPSVDEAAVVHEWTAALDEAFGLADLLDVVAGGVRYRVFLLRSSLQIDLSFFPHDQFRATESAFRLLFGSANAATEAPAPDATHVAGMGWLYAIHTRSASARGRTWQTVLMLDELRDAVETLLCLRFGLNPWHGREVDRPPAAALGALARSRAVDVDLCELDRSRTALTGLLLEEIRHHHDPAKATRLQEPFRDLTAQWPDQSS